jgi:hypothetical protein
MITAAQVREYLACYMEQHNAGLTPNEESAFSTVREVLYDQEEIEEG